MRDPEAVIEQEVERFLHDLGGIPSDTLQNARRHRIRLLLTVGRAAERERLAWAVRGLRDVVYAHPMDDAVYRADVLALLEPTDA